MFRMPVQLFKVRPAQAVFRQQANQFSSLVFVPLIPCRQQAKAMFQVMKRRVVREFYHWPSYELKLS